MRIDAGGARGVRVNDSANNKIRALGVAEQLAETTRRIAFGESASAAMMPKTR